MRLKNICSVVGIDRAYLFAFARLGLEDDVNLLRGGERWHLMSRRL